MTSLRDVRGFARFSWELCAFLHHRMGLAEARDIVLRRFERRADNFLGWVERGVYGSAGSPYRALLRHAGCELGDLRTMVGRHGLEDTLIALRRSGVYVALEEFKGRVPIRRNGLELAVRASDFDNPFLSSQFGSETGGSTGTSARMRHDLDQHRTLSPHHMLALAAHGVLGVPFCVWRGILPDGSGINNILYPAYYGYRPDEWFSQLAPFAVRHPLKYTVSTYYIVLLSRLYGRGIPWPRHVPIDRALVVAEWAARMIGRHGRCLVVAPVSRSLRVCLAAREAGIDLTGATFLMGGEPLTSGKARGIEQSGARCFTGYSLSEVGRIAYGCATPADHTDVHVLKDAFALVAHPHPVEGFEVNVPAFHITTLLTASPKLMLNVEVDDYGCVEERACGCSLGELGFSTHLRGIRSYRKLTGEGVTLMSGDMIRILEEVLPARFGGTALDYQLLEEEDPHGLTRLYLLVHPRLRIADPRAVVDTLLGALDETSVAASAAQLTWRHARSLEIQRREPIWTARGKFSPLYVQHHFPGSPSPSAR